MSRVLPARPTLQVLGTRPVALGVRPDRENRPIEAPPQSLAVDGSTPGETETSPSTASSRDTTSGQRVPGQTEKSHPVSKTPSACSATRRSPIRRGRWRGRSQRCPGRTRSYRSSSGATADRRAASEPGAGRCVVDVYTPLVQEEAHDGLPVVIDHSNPRTLFYARTLALIIVIFVILTFITLLADLTVVHPLAF